jgi:hypothetical protein
VLCKWLDGKKSRVTTQMGRVLIVAMVDY